jgi:hypothetical protein
MPEDLVYDIGAGHSMALFPILLAIYAKIYRFKEEDKCECRARETVVHILVDCPKLREPRKKL